MFLWSTCKTRPLNNLRCDNYCCCLFVTIEIQFELLEEMVGLCPFIWSQHILPFFSFLLSSVVPDDDEIDGTPMSLMDLDPRLILLKKRLQNKRDLLRQMKKMLCSFHGDTECCELWHTHIITELVTGTITVNITY